MTKHTNSSDKGRDAVTDAMDAYLLNGIGALEGWIGPSTLHTKPEYLAAYMQGCAAIHAAEIVAEAIDRLISSKTRINSCKKQQSPLS